MEEIEKYLPFLEKQYPFVVITNSMVVRPEKLRDLLRKHFCYHPHPFPNPKEYYYLFELETDAEYFRRTYVSTF